MAKRRREDREDIAPAAKRAAAATLEALRAELAPYGDGAGGLRFRVVAPGTGADDGGDPRYALTASALRRLLPGAACGRYTWASVTYDAGAGHALAALPSVVGLARAPRLRGFRLAAPGRFLEIVAVTLRALPPALLELEWHDTAVLEDADDAPGAGALLTALAASAGCALRRLCLRRLTLLGTDPAEAAFAALPALRRLELQALELGEVAAAGLAAGLRRCAGLDTLGLAQMPDDRLPALLAALPRSVASLHLAFARLDAPAAAALRAAIDPDAGGGLAVLELQRTVADDAAAWADLAAVARSAERLDLRLAAMNEALPALGELGALVAGSQRLRELRVALQEPTLVQDAADEAPVDPDAVAFFGFLVTTTVTGVHVALSQAAASAPQLRSLELAERVRSAALFPWTASIGRGDLPQLQSLTLCGRSPHDCTPDALAMITAAARLSSTLRHVRVHNAPPECAPLLAALEGHLRGNRSLLDHCALAMREKCALAMRAAAR